LNGYNFTERVRKSLALARSEANRLNHDFVGTEHILLGLVCLDECTATTALRTMGADPRVVRRMIEDTVLTGPPRRVVADGLNTPYTSRAKKVLELSMTEARELHHDYVGTEHVLLGLLREEKGIAAQVLTELGLSLKDSRAAITHFASLPGGKQARDNLARLSAAAWDDPRKRPLYWLLGTRPFTGRLDSLLAELTKQAAQRGREFLSPEDLLLAILQSGGAGRTAVDTLAVDSARIIRMLESAERGDEPQRGPDAAVVQIMESAAEHERQILAGYLGTDHVLLGILATYRGPAYQVLVESGVQYAALLAVIERMSG
jgi:ATP-dependent Clp protease ATP-binding subunit ClpA